MQVLSEVILVATIIKMILADTNDIAEVAFEELSALKFTGLSYRYIASDERSTAEINAAPGNSA